MTQGMRSRRLAMMPEHYGRQQESILAFTLVSIKSVAILLGHQPPAAVTFDLMMDRSLSMTTIATNLLMTPSMTTPGAVRRQTVLPWLISSCMACRTSHSSR